MLSLAHLERMTKLDLDDSAIEDEGAKFIAFALVTNTTLKELDLADKSIGDESAKAIARALEENTSLVKLDLYIIPFG